MRIEHAESLVLGNVYRFVLGTEDNDIALTFDAMLMNLVLTRGNAWVSEWSNGVKVRGRYMTSSGIPWTRWASRGLMASPMNYWYAETIESAVTSAVTT